MDVEVTLLGMSPSSDIERVVAEKARRISAEYPELGTCHVTVHRSAVGPCPGFLVSIDAILPIGELVVSRDPKTSATEDAPSALSQAFDILSHELCVKMGFRRPGEGAVIPPRIVMA